jgi:RNA-directed DNA polymerase
MKEILCSLPIRVYSIYEISKTKGSRTPGIDKVALTGTKDTQLMFLLLNQLEYKYLVKYECKPIKRVYITQERADGSTKIRPLGILTLYDRIVQKMFFTVLDPAIDVLSDPNSYGFRKHRSCHMAISKVSKCLVKNPQDRITLDFDIKGFFDNINHK